MIGEMKIGFDSKDGNQLNKNFLEAKADLYEARENNEELEARVKEAEEAAKIKSEELSHMISRLRKYEKGEYGLQEAVTEVQALKKANELKDRKIEDLTQKVNTFQYECNVLEEENNDMRERLGEDKKERKILRQESKSSSLSTHRQTEKALLQVLQRELERLEEERIQLKTENRKLAQQLGQRAAKLGLDSEDLHAIQEYTEALKNRRAGLSGINGSDSSNTLKLHEGTMLLQKELEVKSKEMCDLRNELNEQQTKYNELYDENDKLRLGMHEILESVKDQDGTSDVQVSSPILENLITILDARHLFGEYKPVMGVKAQVERLEGANSQLREQLRSTRLKEDKASVQIQRLKSKIQSLEGEISSIKQGNISANNQPEPIIIQQQTPIVQINHEIGAANADSVSKLSSQLIYVLDELDVKNKMLKSLKTELETVHTDSEACKHQIGVIYEEYFEAKTNWEKEKSDMQHKISNIEEVNDGNLAKVIEYETLLKSLDDGDDIIKKKLAESSRKMAVLRSNEAILARKYRSLEKQESLLRSDNMKVRDEITSQANKYVTVIGELKRNEEIKNYKLKVLQNSLDESVPLNALESANKEFNEITAKYRDTLEKQQQFSSNSRTIEEMELHLQSNKQENETLKKELMSAREKILSLESLINTIGENKSENGIANQNTEIQRLTKQLATLEIKELNERQKADHVDSQNKLIQMQNKQLEDRNKELEEKFDAVTKSNLELQKVERDLRDELVTSIPLQQFDEISEKHLKENEIVLNLRIENEKLKEVSEVAQNQTQDLEGRKDVYANELESLRHQILDLQSITDEKALIGRLHQQMLSWQNKDMTTQQKVATLQKDISKLEATILKKENKLQSSEQYIVSIRTQYHAKLRSMRKVIQDLRRQYSGSIPLAKQEKFSKTLLEISFEKQKLSTLLFEADSKLKSLETEKEEVDLKRTGVDEILKTLKQSKGTKYILEWHSKLESLRLKELHSRRKAEQVEKQMNHLKGESMEYKKRNEHLEDELLRMESLMEHKQLEWERFEMEKEKEDLPFYTFQKDEKKSFDSKKSLDLDIEAPLSEQLDSSLHINKDLNQEVSKLKAKVRELESTNEDIEKKNKDLENQNQAKERMINDLRLEIPASVDRAIAVSSVIGQPGVQSACLPDKENSQAAAIAHSTIDSLRERLTIKEETIESYEKMFKQSQVEYGEVLQVKQKELTDLQDRLKLVQNSLNELRSTQATYELPTSDVVDQYVKRAANLEYELNDVETTLKESKLTAIELTNENKRLISQLEQSNEDNKILKEEISKFDYAKVKDMEYDIEQMTMQIQDLQNENKSLQQREIIPFKDPLSESSRNFKDSKQKDNSDALKATIDKQKGDLIEKEKKLRAMSKVIADLKNEMMNSAEHYSDAATELNRPVHLQNLVERETRALKIKIDEQLQLIEKLKRQSKVAKEAEKALASEVIKLKEANEKKSSLIVKLREEKAALTRVAARSQSSEEENEEKEELKLEILTLKEKLKFINKAEKPLEETSKEDKVVKNAEEVARWEERKKWQKKVDEMKRKLKEADEEVSKIAKQNDSLRETVSRLDREKMQLDMKWKNHLKIGSTKSGTNDAKVQGLINENAQLRVRIEELEHKTVIGQEPGAEVMKLRVKFLQDRVQQQENKISLLEVYKKGGTTAIMKDINDMRKADKALKASNRKLEDENMNLKVKLETLTHNLFNLEDESKELCKVVIAISPVALESELSHRLNNCSKQISGNILVLNLTIYLLFKEIILK